MREGWNVILRYDEDFDGLKIWFVKQNPDQSWVIVNPMDLSMTHEYEPATQFPEPTLRMTNVEGKQFLQGLAEALVQAGFRPDELKAHNKEMEATKYHLEDMRKLVNEALLPAEVIPRLEERT